MAKHQEGEGFEDSRGRVEKDRRLEGWRVGKDRGLEGWKVG